MSTVNVNTVLDAVTTKRLSIIEKHPLAFMITLLFLAVGFLFYLYVDLNKDFREHLTTANKVMIQTLQENSEALKRSTEALQRYTK